MMSRLVILFILFYAKSGMLLSVNGMDQAAQLEFFEKKIRPLLSSKCYSCHSAKEKIKGGLRLDVKRGLLKGGDSGRIIVPGKPEESLLYEGITYKNVDFQMPPKSRLTPDEIKLVYDWIKAGGYFPDSPDSQTENDGEEEFDIQKRLAAHWWKNSPGELELPEANKGFNNWGRNPIDQFVYSKLRDNDLEPSDRAEKRILIRRLFFDIIGLPPTPVELDKWLSNDKGIDQLVDHLLESTHYGEKWAQHWLDLVRYSETLGHEFDYVLPGAWRYRDYVINAYNSDLPYSDFLMEQVAGDQIANPRINLKDSTNESIKGTIFYWLGQQVHSPVDLLGNQGDVTDNQIDVMTKTFLGLTVSCARCHDHKFDAISTRDYYSLFGTLTSSRYHQVDIDSPAVRGPAIEKLKEQRELLSKSFREQNSKVGERLLKEVSILQKYLNQSSDKKKVSAKKSSLSEVYEDFESGVFSDRWEVEGKAFGTRPLNRSEVKSYQGNIKSLGNFLVNSHNSPDGKGNVVSTDSNQGTLTSKPIKLNHKYLHFLIGGGNHRGKVGLQVLQKGKVVRQQSGFNSNEMRPAMIDLSELSGSEIRLRIIDRHSGGWGNVSIDQIVFSNLPLYFSGQENKPAEIPVDLVRMGKEVGMDIERLGHMMKKVYEGADKQDNDILGKLNREVFKSGLSQKETRWARVNPELSPFLSPSHLDWADWRLIEDAFSDSQVEVGDLVFDGEGVSVSEFSGIHSGKVDPRLEGTASSPTFVIKEPYLHVLCSGKDARIRVVMENFNLIRGPIYGGIAKKPNWESPRWVTFDLSMWIGNDAYLQLNDFQINDLAHQGSSARATGAIYYYTFSSQRSAPVLYETETEGSFTSLTSEAFEALAEGRKLEPAQAAWVNDLVEHGLIDLVGISNEILNKKRIISNSLPAPTRIPGMIEGFGRDENISIRGNPRNIGEKAERGYLEAFFPSKISKTALGKKVDAKSKGSGRLEFANWMLSKDNPLTARVYVNRIWYHLFGEGLVATVDDMGLMGRTPTHPRLLDWLSAWFVEEANWSTRRLIRLIVNSSTYQQSAKPRGDKWKIVDPNNKYLHSARIRRLPAELIRDSILVSSGSLNTKQFGKSIPIHLTKFMEGRGKPGKSGPIDGDGRRSIYVEIRRNFISPMLLAFDKPIPYTTTGRRSRSNVPAQALILMNDKFVQDQAKKMGRSLVDRFGQSKTKIVQEAYKISLGRLPSENELQVSKAFIEMQKGQYSSQDAFVSAVSDFCHTVFNLKEYIFIQ